MKELKGKTINKVLIDDGTLTFDTSDGLVSYYTWGDCCSESYFYEVTGVNKILGKEIVEVKSIDLEVEEGTEEIGCSGVDCLVAYGIRISSAPSMEKLKDGNEVEVSNSMIVVFRNNSNGYYGGDVSVTEVHMEEGEEITDNWRTN